MTTTVYEKDIAGGLWVDFTFVAISFIALFIKVIPIMPISILYFVYAIIRFNLYENIFGFIVFFSSIAGYIFTTIGINHVGGIMKYLGLVMLIMSILSGRVKVKYVMRGLLPLLILLSVLIVSVATSSGGDYARPKLSATITNGFILYFTFLFLFSNKENFDYSKMGMSFIVLSVMLLPMSLVTNGIAGPSNPFDFGFLRFQTHDDLALLAAEDEEFHISYQNSGFLLLQGLGFFLIDAKKNKLNHIVLMLCVVLYALLMGGSRQAIVSVFLMISIWLWHNYRKENSGKKFSPLEWIITIAVFVIIVLLAYRKLTAEDALFSSVAESGYIEGGGRGDWLLAGVSQFLEQPLTGVGYGRFIIFGEYGSYPHNLFVELLCETGLLGFAIFIILGLLAIYHNRTIFFSYIVLWLPFFLRAMASEDLSMNILVFVFLFALYPVQIAQKKQLKIFLFFVVLLALYSVRMANKKQTKLSNV